MADYLFVPMTSKLNVLSRGRGRERKVKGSKRTLLYPHILHVTTDLSCKGQSNEAQSLREA